MRPAKMCQVATGLRGLWQLVELRLRQSSGRRDAPARLPPGTPTTSDHPNDGPSANVPQPRTFAVKLGYCSTWQVLYVAAATPVSRVRFLLYVLEVNSHLQARRSSQSSPNEPLLHCGSQGSSRCHSSCHGFLSQDRAGTALTKLTGTEPAAHGRSGL